MAIVINGSTGISATESSSVLGDGAVEAADLASGAAASNLGTGNVTAAMLASTLDLTGKTVTLPAGTGGKVLQILQVKSTDTPDGSAGQAFSTTSTSFVDTGLSESITPSSASSKILVMVNGGYWGMFEAADYNAAGAIYRDSTNIFTSWTNAQRSVGGNGITNCSLVVLDSPNTTSSVTYTLYARSTTSNRVYVHNPETNTTGGAGISMTLLEISA